MLTFILQFVFHLWKVLRITISFHIIKGIVFVVSDVIFASTHSINSLFLVSGWFRDIKGNKINQTVRWNFISKAST